jgi:hypothetical protein
MKPKSDDNIFEMRQIYLVLFGVLILESKIKFYVTSNIFELLEHECFIRNLLCQ